MTRLTGAFPPDRACKRLPAEAAVGDVMADFGPAADEEAGAIEALAERGMEGPVGRLVDPEDLLVDPERWGLVGGHRVE